jgi:hypothetical protein
MRSSRRNRRQRIGKGKVRNSKRKGRSDEKKNSRNKTQRRHQPRNRNGYAAFAVSNFV